MVKELSLARTPCNFFDLAEWNKSEACFKCHVLSFNCIVVIYFKVFPAWEDASKGDFPHASIQIIMQICYLCTQTQII